MNAKQYLRQIEELDIKIKQKQEQLDCLRETAGGAAAIRYDKMNVQVTVIPDIVERNVMKLIELDEQIFVLKMQYRTLRNEAISRIDALDNENEKVILKLHYIEFYSFRKISAELGKDIRWMKRVHSRALKSFDMLYGVDRPLPNDVK